MKKFHFIFDKTKKNLSLKNIFFKKYKNYLPQKSDVVLVFGGDGFMLKTLKKLRKYNKPFYGINMGSYGFLMNKLKSYNIEQLVSKAQLVSISPLQMDVMSKNGKTYSNIAINEVSLLRQTRQASSLQVTIGKRILIKKLICDGVLVSTPAGSTAYNLSVSGPILSLNSKKIVVTPISPFRPRRLKGKVLPSTSVIFIKNINIKKRPVSAVADKVEIRNIKNVRIKINNKIKFKLLYNKNYSLIKKINIEKLKKK